VTITIRRLRRLRGELRLPGDKSISHRALLLNALAEGTSQIEGLSAGADVASTAGCLRALGVEIENGRVHGVGLHGLQPPAGPLDCGNSGTTMRLIAGVAAGQPFPMTLVGDASLSRRPMDRVAKPLLQMGAQASTSPLRVRGGNIHAIEYHPPVASAQVKAALLLAGLWAKGETRVVETVPTRDHTERMLAAMGASVEVAATTVKLRGPAQKLNPLSLTVPGDISAAAFWLIAGAIHPDAEITLRGVGVNPTRIGLLTLLARSGAEVEVSEQPDAGAEPVADLSVVTASSLKAMQIGGGEVAGLIDELPVLAVAATAMPGVSQIRDAGELRVKECDRIAAMAEGLQSMGAAVEELPDGWQIAGPSRLKGTRVRSFGDHRVAMALAVAGLIAEGETEIDDPACVTISYPTFWTDLESLSR
jgi:3-phosphoshikimate 1-carboxyvinyltransferase